MYPILATYISYLELYEVPETRSLSNVRLCIHTHSADIMPHLHKVARKMFSILLVMYYVHIAKPQHQHKDSQQITCVDRYTNRPSVIDLTLVVDVPRTQNAAFRETLCCF